jgi:hypothetical protein
MYFPNWLLPPLYDAAVRKSFLIVCAKMCTRKKFQRLHRGEASAQAKIGEAVRDKLIGGLARAHAFRA